MKRILVLLLLTVCSSAYSKNMLTLEDAIAIGLEISYGVKISRNERQIAANNNTLGSAGLLPVVDLSADYTKSVSNAKIETVLGGKLDKTGGLSDALTAGVNLHWTLFDGMKMFFNLDLQKSIEQQGELKIRSEIETTIAEIMRAYFETVSIAQALELMRLQIELSQFRLSIVQTNFDAGMASQLELNKATVDLNKDKTAYTSCQTALVLAKTKLNALLSRNSSEDFDVASDYTLITTDEVDAYINRASDGNTKLKMLEKYYEISCIEAKKETSRQSPTIDFHMGYNYLWSETETNFVKSNLNYGLAFGLTARYNIFNGFNDSREIENSKIEAEIANHRAEQYKVDLDAFLKKTVDNFAESIALLTLFNNNLKIAQQNIEIAKDSYAAGSISALELRDFQNDVLQISMNIANTRFKAKLCEIDLLLAAGGLTR